MKGKKFLIGMILVCGIIFWLQKGYAHQKFFYNQEDMECTSVFGIITMEDRLKGINKLRTADLSPGDILITLSTHTLGWRHGHAGLVIDENTVLECVLIGQDSKLMNVEHWKKYSNVAVLRVQGVEEKQQKEVVEYALSNLCGVPYHLSSGFIGKKDTDIEEAWFGAQCAYLVWYVWNHFGYDLDSDGGRLVTCTDILESKKIEVVQSYGMHI